MRRLITGSVGCVRRDALPQRPRDREVSGPHRPDGAAVPCAAQTFGMAPRITRAYESTVYTRRYAAPQAAVKRCGLGPRVRLKDGLVRFAERLAVEDAYARV